MKTSLAVATAGALGATAASAAMVLVAATRDADGGASAATVALAPWVESLPDEYMVTGAKAEQSFTELVRYGRSGDTFVVEIEVIPQGGHAGGRERRVLTVDSTGTIRRTPCADACVVDGTVHGHLATASLLAAARAGRLPATGERHAYAGRSVICVDNRLLGEPDPVVDPCFDEATGAELAQRSRHDGSFGGPTLLAGSVVVSDRVAADLVDPVADHH